MTETWYACTHPQRPLRTWTADADTAQVYSDGGWRVTATTKGES